MPTRVPPSSAPRIAYSRRQLLQRRRWQSAGGKARSAQLSPATRSEIARAGYVKMMETRCMKILEAVLFGIQS